MRLYFSADVDFLFFFFVEGHCGNEVMNIVNQQGRSWDRQREISHQHQNFTAPSNSLMMMNSMQQESQYVLQFPYVTTTQISSSSPSAAAAAAAEQELVKEDRRSNNNSDNTTIAPPFIDFLGVGAT